MLIHSVRLTNFLSFGPSSQEIPLRELNIIIGSNGSGKSNFLESIALLSKAPDEFVKPIREGGGVRDWLWKGTKTPPTAVLDFIVDNPRRQKDLNLRYQFSFTEVSQRFEFVDERIEDEKPANKSHPQPYFYYHFNSGKPVLNVNSEGRFIKREDIDLDKSIISQRRDPEQYPEITYLGDTLRKIRLYREWSFGRNTIPRQPQKTDLPNEFLEPDASNLGLVLNRLRREPEVKKRLLKALQALYEGIDDYEVSIDSGTVQVFFQEGRFNVPATRLSDGTLRYLCLLAILCHPNPPPLICIEEPELGLHPDVLPRLAELLIEASERTQIIVTTHSDVLVDAMSDRPESILVAEKGENGTTLTRLDKEKLKPWLEKYLLGKLWIDGEIGGKRW